jgi:hypothetical protein
MDVNMWLEIVLVFVVGYLGLLRLPPVARIMALEARLLELEGRQSIAESQRWKPYLCYRCEMAHDTPTVAR